MNIPQIQIETRPAKLGLQIDKPQQSIEQPKASIQQSQPAAILDIRRTQPTLTIDQTEAWASMERKHILRAMDEFAKEGLSAVQEGMARRASEGTQMMRIEDGGEAIQNIAKNNAYPPPADINVRFLLGRFGVEFSIEPGTTDIHVEPQKPTLDVQVHKPIHEYTPGKVSGVMEDYGEVRIDVRV